MTGLDQFFAFTSVTRAHNTWMLTGLSVSKHYLSFFNYIKMTKWTNDKYRDDILYMRIHNLCTVSWVAASLRTTNTVR